MLGRRDSVAGVDEPLVSVVVPVFNGLAYLDQMLESVFAQTHGNLEIVLVDGGSTDGSLEWLGDLADPRITVHALPQGTPAATTWSTASSHATGAFVKLLCQDDLITPDAIERQVRDLSAHPDAGMVANPRDIVSASGKVLFRSRGCDGVRPGEVDGRTAITVAYRRAQNIFGEPLAVLFRRAALQDHLPWNDTYPFMLDLEMYTRVLLDGPVVIGVGSVGAFRVSTSSWSTRLVASQRSQFRAWQQATAPLLGSELSAADRRTGEINLHVQTQLRRAVYTWLRWRRDIE